MGALVATIVAAICAAAATAFAAVQSRRANSATVDVRILKYLQDDVVLLQQRVQQLRTDLIASQTETDEERRVRRRVENELMAMQDLVQRMSRALTAAGIVTPEITAQQRPQP